MINPQAARPPAAVSPHDDLVPTTCLCAHLRPRSHTPPTSAKSLASQKWLARWAASPTCRGASELAPPSACGDVSLLIRSAARCLAVPPHPDGSRPSDSCEPRLRAGFHLSPSSHREGDNGTALHPVKLQRGHGACVICSNPPRHRSTDHRCASRAQEPSERMSQRHCERGRRPHGAIYRTLPRDLHDARLIGHAAHAPTTSWLIRLCALNTLSRQAEGFKAGGHYALSLRCISGFLPSPSSACPWRRRRRPFRGCTDICVSNMKKSAFRPCTPNVAITTSSVLQLTDHGL